MFVCGLGSPFQSGSRTSLRVRKLERVQLCKGSSTQTPGGLYGAGGPVHWPAVIGPVLVVGSIRSQPYETATGPAARTLAHDSPSDAALTDHGSARFSWSDISLHSLENICSDEGRHSQAGVVSFVS